MWTGRSWKDWMRCGWCDVGDVCEVCRDMSCRTPCVELRLQEHNLQCQLRNVRSCSATASRSRMGQCPESCSCSATAFLTNLLFFDECTAAAVDETNNRDHHVTPVKHDSFELEALLLVHRSSGTKVNFPLQTAAHKFPSNTICNRLNGSRYFICECRCSGEQMKKVIICIVGRILLQHGQAIQFTTLGQRSAVSLGVCAEAELASRQQLPSCPQTRPHDTLHASNASLSWKS